jgi:predicted nucleic acid-binding Zn ribbon protein
VLGVVPCHHCMACPSVANRGTASSYGEGTNILNTQQQQEMVLHLGGYHWANNPSPKKHSYEKS